MFQTDMEGATRDQSGKLVVGNISDCSRIGKDDELRCTFILLEGGICVKGKGR